MTNKTCTIVKLRGEGKVSQEDIDAMAKSYGVHSAVTNPPEDDTPAEGVLYLAHEGSRFIKNAERGQYGFPVRIVTYMVAMEMVKVDKETGFQ